MSTSLLRMHLFFLFKEAYFYARWLGVRSRCASRGLKEQAKGWQGFLHLTLQEYFVAQYVTDYQCLDILLSHRGDPWWEEVLLLYAGHTPDVSSLISRLLGEGDEPLPEDLFSTNLLLAGRCLATKPTLQQVDLWQRVIDRLFEQTVTSLYSLTQSQSAEVLVAIGDKEVNLRLVALLSDEHLDPSMRWSIIEALGMLGERSVAPHLLSLLSNEQLDPSMRWNIADALGRLGERSMAPHLLPLLSDEQLNLDVRRSIAMALGMLGERSVAPHLLSLLSNEQLNPHVRGHIAEALGELGERSAAPHLLLLLSNEQLNTFVRWGIAIVLGELGECSVVPHLLSLLSNEQLNPYVREGIATALGILGGRSVAPHLLSLLSNEQLNPHVRGSIAQTIETVAQDEATVRALATLLLTSDIADAIYSALWTVSRRVGVHIYIQEGIEGNQYQIVKW